MSMTVISCFFKAKGILSTIMRLTIVIFAVMAVILVTASAQGTKPPGARTTPKAAENKNNAKNGNSATKAQNQKENAASKAPNKDPKGNSASKAPNQKGEQNSAKKNSSPRPTPKRAKAFY